MPPRHSDGDYIGTDAPDTSTLWDKQVTHFPFDQIDGAEEELEPDEMATAALTQTLQWFLGFCFYSKKGDKKPIAVAFKRMLALVYILRPDLLHGATLDDLTVELGESRNALSRWTAELTYMFGAKGLNQQVLLQKIRQHFKALAEFDSTRGERATTVQEWLNNMNLDKFGRDKT